MKIGIITLTSPANYGNILQAWALQTSLNNIGHESTVLYLKVRWEINYLKFPYVLFKRLCNKYIKKQPCRIFAERYNNKTYGILIQNTKCFIDKHINHIKYKSYSEIKESDFNAFVVGSDQVWRPAYSGKNLYNHFLDFAKKWNVGRFAYAASFGTSDWEYSEAQEQRCKKLASKFDWISVRERSAVELCCKYLNCKSDFVLDPTLLISKSNYLELINNYPKRDGGLLNYILDETKDIKDIIHEIEEKEGISSFRVNSKYDDYSAPLTERIQPSVEQWLAGFRDSDMVITDSFHACVFSIIFNKPFWVVANHGRGYSRFDSLLSTFGLSNRIISSNQIPNNEPIDWDSVNRLKENLASESMAKLSAALLSYQK